MTAKPNKLQIRAELLNTIKILNLGDKHTQSFLDSVLEPLKKIEDKDTILDILTKELSNTSDESRYLILAFLLENLISKEKLESELWKLLSLPNIEDATKAYMINILKDLGNQINYEKFTEYFENPDAVIDADTEKMLQSAINNPEALIDFLDFIEALPSNDKNILIDSLCEDYNGDELANLFSPVIYSMPNSELCKYAIKKLGESKSSLAVQPLNFILDFSDNEEIKNATKKSLTALKLAGARQDTSDTFYKKAFEASKISDVFISMPDGKGNVGILLSRKRNEKNSVQMFAVVFNDTIGIVDCFGFNDITEKEFLRIVDKFYQNQEKICISPALAKSLLTKAEKLSLTISGKVPYEYVCWKRIILDVETFENLTKILENNLEIVEITNDDLDKIYRTTTIFDKWFVATSDDVAFLALIEKITNIINSNDGHKDALKQLEKCIQDTLNSIWIQDNVEKLDYRLLLSAYLLNINGFKTHANIINSIRFNQAVKNSLFNNMIKTSVYQFLLRELEKHNNTLMSANIFSKRNKENKSQINKPQLENILSLIEEQWGC